MEPVVRLVARPDLTAAQSAHIASSEMFQTLVSSRTKFVLAAGGFAFLFNVAQPVLSVFTTVLDGYAIGSLTWGWVYAFAQMLVPLVILQLYLHHSQGLDRMSAQIQQTIRTER